MISCFDAHCDTVSRCMRRGTGDLWKNDGQLDLRRLSAYDRCAQVFALFWDAAKTTDPWAECLRMYEYFSEQMRCYSHAVCHCRTAAEVEQSRGKVAALLSIEGGELLSCDPARVSTAAEWGVRLCNPVWNHANVLSGTNAQEPDRGLSPKGRDFIQALEEHNIYADVSHLSDVGFWDLVRISRQPIVASHSNSRAICAHRRNLTDDQFRAIRDTGGVVGLNLYLPFVGGESMDDLVRHVEHFLEMDGEKTLCLGSDLDGCDLLAAGMRGAEDVPRIYKALQQRGYHEALLEDIFWNNLMRLL